MFNIILFALFLTLLGTHNGRQLIILSARKISGYVPYDIRRVLIANTNRLPLFISRRLLFFATQPTANERKWIHKVTQHDWKGVWITPYTKNTKEAEDQALNQDLIILFIHGGGFSIGYSYMYMPLFQFILGQLEKQYNIRASLLSLEYSLSPEHKWPIACHEAVQSYRYLVHELGISPSRIVLMGDSAGGNLALTTLINLRDLRVKRKEKTQNTPPLPLPAGIGLISPWVDLTTDIYPSRPDCVSPRLLNMYISNYAPHQNLTHSLISPVHATLEGLSSCHWLVTYGEHEIIRESIQTLVSRIEQHNYSLKTLVCASEAHVSMTHPLMSTTPEAFRRDGGTLIQWLADISA